MQSIGWELKQLQGVGMCFSDLALCDRQHLEMRFLQTAENNWIRNSLDSHILRFDCDSNVMHKFTRHIVRCPRSSTNQLANQCQRCDNADARWIRNYFKTSWCFRHETNVYRVREDVEDQSDELTQTNFNHELIVGKQRKKKFHLRVEGWMKRECQVTLEDFKCLAALNRQIIG